ncbi:MAG: glycosyltransferase [Elusimicrobia bacterium]|nr:glycosyltransferase [Elusimicrobiota bacterium]
MTQEAAPRVSVVIPAYNAASFIEKTLDAVRAQTFKDFEIVVTDDGSTDGTQAVVEGYLKRYSLKGRCIRQENKKIAAARNTAMRASRGDFIAFLDHDDLWYPEKLEVVLAEFQKHPEADLVCHSENITQNGKILRVAHYGPWVPDMYERLLLKGNALSPSSTTVRREKAFAVGGFRENPEFNTVEDYDYWMRLSRVAAFRFITCVLGEYQVVERAASRRVEYHHSNLEALLRDHFADYFGEDPSSLDRQRMRRRLSAVYRSALGQLMEHREAPERQREYALKMLRTFPFDPKNLARGLLWLARSSWK